MKDNVCSAVHHTTGGLALKNNSVFVYIIQISARSGTVDFVIVNTRKMSIAKNKFKKTERREMLVKKRPEIRSPLDQNRSGGTNVSKSLVFETRYVLWVGIVSFIITVTLQQKCEYALYVKLKQS
jgi:hypothetical protein